MGQEKVSVLVLGPDQRYRLVGTKRSRTISPMLEMSLGKGEKGGYIDDLRSPSIWSQYAPPYIERPEDIQDAAQSAAELPRGMIMSQSHGAIALEASGLLLSTDTSLRDAQPDEPDDEWIQEVADTQRGLVQATAHQEAVAGATRDQSRADLLDRLIWVLAIVAIIAAIIVLILLGPRLIESSGDIAGGISLPGIEAAP